MALTNLGKPTSTSAAMPWGSGSSASHLLWRCLSRTLSTALMTSKAGQSHSLAVMHGTMTRRSCRVLFQLLFQADKLADTKASTTLQVS